jgi:hypothetical protein
MQKQVYGVRQITTRDCGAASCLYVLIMLGCGQLGEARRPIMDAVRTAWGTDFFGSTPTNIGNYIVKRCVAAGKTTVRVERANGHNPVGHVGGRVYLYALGPTMLEFNASSLPGNDPELTINWTKGQGRPDLAILRMIAPQEGGYFKPHWVVQTHFDGGIQVMDPDGGSITEAASAGREQAQAMKASVELSANIASSEEKRRKVLDRAYVSGGGARRMRIDVNKATGVQFRRPTNEFEVHVANHGRMTAALKRIRYGFFDPAAEIPPKPTYECIIFRDMIGPGEKKLTAVVALPPENKTQVIFARLDYYDVGLAQDHSIGFAVSLKPDDEYPVPYDVPSQYIRDE